MSRRNKKQAPEAELVVEPTAPKSSKSWSLASKVAPMLAATITAKALDTFWKSATGKKPPANAADPAISMTEAISWATLSGTSVAVAKMLATRRASNYYTRSTGHLPPGVEPRDD